MDSAGHSKKKHLVHSHASGKKLHDPDLFNVKYPKTGIGSNVSNRVRNLMPNMNIFSAVTCPRVLGSDWLAPDSEGSATGVCENPAESRRRC